jgi:YrbI family 3-deoxy-D-manno-octulosonate 8-phosphate phosphatase
VNSKHIELEKLDALVFDFDGVLTDNRVLLDQNGKEFVYCSRGDGLGFDVLRKLKKPVFILSTEENSVVTARGDKLRVSVIQGVNNKVDALQELATKENVSLDKVLYIGNDLNDYYAMSLCGYSACPADSHASIKQLANITLKTKGGAGVVRELLEDVLKIDFLAILY